MKEMRRTLNRFGHLLGFLALALFVSVPLVASALQEKSSPPAELALITDADLADSYLQLYEKLTDMEGELVLYSTYSETESEINRISALLSEQIALGNIDQSAYEVLMRVLREKFNTLKHEW